MFRSGLGDRFATIGLAAVVVLGALAPIGPVVAQGEHWKPETGLSWEIQISSVPKADDLLEVQAYDVDLFEADAALLESMENRGIRTICYFSAGSYEAWRSDAKRLKKFRGSKLRGWQGEWWIDIRKKGVRNVMKKRLDLAKQKGCDAVDPDNVDGYANQNGLGLKRSHQVKYLRFLAREAHARGMAIGLKNAVELIPALEPQFDFTVNEECFDYNECDTLERFISAGKPVLQIQYGDNAAARENAAEQWCDKANAREFSTLIKGWDLDEQRIDCQTR